MEETHLSGREVAGGCYEEVGRVAEELAGSLEQDELTAVVHEARMRDLAVIGTPLQEQSVSGRSKTAAARGKL